MSSLVPSGSQIPTVRPELRTNLRSSVTFTIDYTKHAGDQLDSLRRYSMYHRQQKYWERKLRQERIHGRRFQRHHQRGFQSHMGHLFDLLPSLGQTMGFNLVNELHRAPIIGIYKRPVNYGTETGYFLAAKSQYEFWTKRMKKEQGQLKKS